MKNYGTKSDMFNNSDNYDQKYLEIKFNLDENLLF